MSSQVIFVVSPSIFGTWRRALWMATLPMLVFLGSAAPRTQAPAPTIPAFQESGLRPATPVFSQFPFETIDMINRNVMLRFVDLHLPGNGGFDLTFTRVHNSRDGIWRFGIEQAPMELAEVGGGDECNFALKWSFTWGDGSTESTDCDNGPGVLNTSRYGRFRKNDFALELPSGLVATYDFVFGACTKYEMSAAFRFAISGLNPPSA